MPFPLLPKMKVVNIPRNGLVYEHLFSNNYLDTSDNGYDAINNGNSFTTNRKATANSATQSTGASWVNTDAAIAGLSGNIKGSLCQWVRPTDATPATNTVIASWSSTTTNEFIRIINLTTGKILIDARLGGVTQWDIRTNNVVLSDFVWTFVSIVQDSVLPIIYIGKTVVAQTCIGGNKSAWFSSIPNIDNGRYCDQKFNSNPERLFYTGGVDDARGYNRNLSQSEITALANE